MNDKSIQVLEQYEVEVKGIFKGRGALLIETDKGMLRIGEYKGTAARLIYENELLNYLREKGFGETGAIIKNKEDALFSSDYAGVKYTLTRHYSGNECDVRNRNDVMEGVRTLARLHLILQDVSIEDSEYIPVLTGVDEEMKKHNRELKRIRTFIREKTNKTRFEYDVLAHFDSFYTQALEAADRMEKSAYKGLNERAIQRNSICHGNYNYHNIIKQDGKMVVINFEHSGRGLLIRDLYFFMRKVLEKHDWNGEIGREMFENYKKIKSVSKEEKEILHIMFSYPEKFWKVLNHYYNGNKAYLSDQIKDKMKRVYVQQSKKDNFNTSF